MTIAFLMDHERPVKTVDLISEVMTVVPAETGFLAKSTIKKIKSVRWPGIEPGSNAWKASMLTITPPTLEDARFTNRINNTYKNS